jgi:hypothetical protein
MEGVYPVFRKEMQLIPYVSGDKIIYCPNQALLRWKRDTINNNSKKKSR